MFQVKRCKWDEDRIAWLSIKTASPTTSTEVAATTEHATVHATTTWTPATSSMLHH